MTIKEVEARTGLARANIRYYEDQGFFIPERGENGYRNYMVRDVDILLKIKLLRQLGFSLEEIHDLQRGVQDMAYALEKREAGLEREQRELGQTLRLCRDLRADQVDFNTLDAGRYLDRLALGADALKEDRAPKRVFPWRRFFARNLDRALWATLVNLLCPFSMGLLALQKGKDPGQRLLLELLILSLAAVSETVLIHRFGTTPGKALFGLKIVREDGSFLSLGESARRACSVAMVLALFECMVMLPPFLRFLSAAQTAFLIWACWQAYQEKPLPWERGNQVYLDGSTKEASFWQRKNSWLRPAAYVLAVLACSGLSLAAARWAALPPNRGPELTVEQFVENYNFYDAYDSGSANLPWQLSLDGTYHKRAGNRDGRWDLDWGADAQIPLPTLQFTQEDGVVTGASIRRAGESGKPLPPKTYCWEIIPYNHLRLTLLALGFERDEAEEVYQELIESKSGLHRQLSSGRVDCEVRFSGYETLYSVNTQENILRGIEGEEQSYFVEFTVSLE